MKKRKFCLTFAFAVVFVVTGVIVFFLVVGNKKPQNETFTIIWKNYDDTVLEIDEDILGGSMPCYDGDVPIRAEDEQYTYVFNGWAPEVVLVDQDTEYIAQYITSLQQYRISIDESIIGGEVLNCGIYEHGDEVEVTALPYLGFDFLGWYSDDELITTSKTAILVVEKDVQAKFGVKSEMSNFNFVSTFTSCEINGVKQNGTKEIVVPTYVTSIGLSAFANCSYVESISLPFVGENKNGEGNTYFGSIFGANTVDEHPSLVPASLKTVILRETERIGVSSFALCENILNVVILDGVEIIDDSAFTGCTALEKVIFNSQLKRIARFAFCDCENIKSLEIPNGVKSIEASAFNGCKGIKKAIIPNSVIEIGNYAFYDTAVKEIQGPVSAIYKFPYIALETVVVTAGDQIGTWFSHTQIKSLTISEGIKEIAPLAFHNCKSLETVILNNELENIGSEAFCGCTSLKKIVIPNSVKKIGGGVFRDCSLESLSLPFVATEQNGTTRTNMGSFFATTVTASNNGDVPSSLKKLEILGGEIGAYAVSYCSSIEKLVLGKEIEKIGNGAFSNCSALDSVSIECEIESIGQSIFRNCTKLIAVDIPVSVKSIKEYAFMGCSSLVSINIPDGTTTISEYAFADCVSLETLVVSNTVSSIGQYAFRNCPIKEATIPTIAINQLNKSTLTNVAITAGEKIANSAFNSCASLKTINIADTVTEIGAYAFASCSALENVICGKNIEMIAEQAFASCEALTNICIGNSLKSIGGYAFVNCCSLISIEIPGGTTTIGYNAFKGCDSLESLTLPFIGVDVNSKNGAFLGALFGATSYSSNSTYVPSSLKKITINGNTIIESYSFYNCSSIVEIVIQEGTTRIGSCAFEGCSSLESIKLPISVVDIWNNAFKRCNKLTIICEVNEKPSGWESSWNPENCPVVWGLE